MTIPASCLNSTLTDNAFQFNGGIADLGRLNSTVADAILQVDSDIAGLGVRLSFYLQTFILVLLANRSSEDAPGALWTLTATSCGLTVAAIVQEASRSLSLLEAILVAQLVWLANIASFIAAASYSRSKGKDVVVKFVTVAQGYFSMILTIVMWAKADKLGEFPQCNGLVIFVIVFGVETPALGAGRTAALVCSSVLLCGYTFLTLEELIAWWKHRLSRTSSTYRRRRRRPSRRVGDEQQTNAKPEEEIGPRNKWLPTDVDPIFVGVVLVESIIFAYFLTTTELLIKKTRVFQPANHQWGFGQVFAITVITPSLVSLYRGMRENKMARRRDKRLRKNAQDRAAKLEEGRLRRHGSIELVSRSSNGNS